MGNISTNGTISAQRFIANGSTGTSWVEGIKGSAALNYSRAFYDSAYFPILNFTTQNNWKVSFGGINDAFGFYANAADKTENGYDKRFELDITENVIKTTFTFGGRCNVADSADALGGYSSDLYIRRLDWVRGDSNSINTLGIHGTGFAYSNTHGTPGTGPFCSFGGTGWLTNYVLQFHAPFSNKNPRLYWRTYNGDSGSWNNWKAALMVGDTLNTANFGTSTPSGSASNGDIYFKLI